MIIRPPAPADFETLIELRRRACTGKTAILSCHMTPPRVQTPIVEYMNDRTNRCALVADRAGELIGMVGEVSAEYFSCHEKLVADEALFVQPDRRGSLAAVRLIEALQTWATGSGARELCLSIPTNVNPAGTGRLYQGLGFAPAGGVCRKRLPSTTISQPLKRGR